MEQKVFYSGGEFRFVYCAPISLPPTTNKETKTTNLEPISFLNSVIWIWRCSSLAFLSSWTLRLPFPPFAPSKVNRVWWLMMSTFRAEYSIESDVSLCAPRSRNFVLFVDLSKVNEIQKTCFSSSLCFSFDNEFR